MGKSVPLALPHDCAQRSEQDQHGYPATLGYGHPVYGYDVWPEWKSLCQAKRCTNGCGCYEHTKPADLVDGCLRHDLVEGYVDGPWCGPGLIVQLRQALDQPSAALPGSNAEGGTRNKPGSKPPGWNAAASELLEDVHARLVVADEETLGDWRRQARTILGFSVPSIALDNVLCFACKQPSLRVAQDASSDVWCGSATCHDDDKYPQCSRDADGRPECRKTDRARNHAVRWRRDSWTPIWEQMQKDAQLEHAS